MIENKQNEINECHIDGHEHDIYGSNAESVRLVFGWKVRNPTRLTFGEHHDIAVTAYPAKADELAAWKIERTGLRNRIDKTLLRSARLPGHLILRDVLAVFPALQDAYTHGRELGAIEGEEKTQDALLEALGIRDRLRKLEHAARVAKNDLDDLWG